MFGLKMRAIMRRDLLKLSRNPITLVSVILMPIVYLVIIGNSFPGQLKHLSLVVVSQDHGHYGRRMVEKLLALQAGPKTVDVTFESDLGAAIDEVRNGTLQGRRRHPARVQPNVRRGPRRANRSVHRQRRYRQLGHA